jgi:hypothetical protein
MGDPFLPLPIQVIGRLLVVGHCREAGVVVQPGAGCPHPIARAAARRRPYNTLTDSRGATVSTEHDVLSK